MSLAILSMDCLQCGSETLRIIATAHVQLERDHAQCEYCGQRVSDDAINIQLGLSIRQRLSQYIMHRHTDVQR
jgi:transcription elongation factor Elf1